MTNLTKELLRAAEKVEQRNNDDDIMVTGYSIRAPESEDTTAFYQNLASGKDMTVESRRYPKGGYCGLPPRAGNLPTLEEFDHQFFKYGRKQADNMDQGVRILLEVVQEALLDAKIDIASLKGSKTGCYIGAGWVDSLSRSKGKEELTGYEIVHGYPGMMANKISFFYDLIGPSVTLDAACSSSMCALSAAFDDLKSGKVERAIVGGVSITSDPNINRMFNAYTMLSPTGHCWTFDARADGYCRSEGIGVMILEKSNVQEYGYAVLKGVSCSSSGHMKEGITFPSSEAQAKLCEEVLDMSGVKAADIAYVEAHGTGTKVGDRIELEGMNSVYPQHGMPVGSVKSNMGHAECASGMMAMIKLMLMMEKETLLPNIGFELENCPHEHIKSGKFKVPTKLEAWKPGLSVVMNYGFGGTNGVACFAPGNVKIDANAKLVGKTNALCFGGDVDNVAMSAEALGLQATWFQEQCSLGNDQAYKVRSLGKIGLMRNGSPAGRESSVTVSTHVVDSSTDRSSRESSPHNSDAASDADHVSAIKPQTVSPDTKICFLLDGQGSQWQNMGTKLMVDEPIFRDTIHRLNDAVPDEIDLVDMYEKGDMWFDKRYTVLGLVSYHIGLINLLKARGIHPDYYMGHSLGETACGYLAGYQTEAQTIQIALMRSALVSLIRRGWSFLVSPDLEKSGLEKCVWDGVLVKDDDGNQVYYVPNEYTDVKEGENMWKMNGLMQAYGMSAADIQAAIDHLGLKQTCVACLNSPTGQTVSGAIDEMKKLEAFFKEQNPQVFIRDIPTDGVAYHAPYARSFQKTMISVIRDVMGTVDEEIPKEWLGTSGNERYTEGYHAENVCGSVYFQEAIEALPAGTIIMEVGPSKGLLTQIKRIRKDVTPYIMVTPNVPEDFSQLRQNVWLAGGKIQWSDVDNSARLPVEYRYPNLWDHNTKLNSWIHTDYPMFGKSDTNSHTVKFDLKNEWASMLGHRVCGRVLLPATSYLYAVWESFKFEPMEIIDLKIHAALELTAQMEEVKLNVTWNADGFYQVMYKDELKVTCRANAQGSTKPAILTAPQFGNGVQKEASGYPEGREGDGSKFSLDDKFAVDGKALYPYIQQHGYEYRDDYRRIASYDFENDAAIMCENKDWVSYLDGLLHLLVFNVESNVLPTGFGRVFLNNGNGDVKDADLWAVVDHNTKTLGNTSVVIEDWRMDPGFGAAPGPPSTENAVNFFDYGHNLAEDAPFLGQVLKWDAEGYRSTISDHDFTRKVIENLSGISATVEGDESDKDILIMPELDLETAKTAPFGMLIVDGKLEASVATDLNVVELCSFEPMNLDVDEGEDEKTVSICVYRKVSQDKWQWTADWKDVQKNGKDENGNPVKIGFYNTQKGAGTLGFARTLQKESWGDVHGVYFSELDQANVDTLKRRIEALNMRLTFVNGDGSIGCTIERPLAEDVCNANITYGEGVHLKVNRPGNLDSFVWQSTSATTKVEYAALNFRDIMRAFGRLKEVDMSVGLEFSGFLPDGTRVAGIGKNTIGTHCESSFSIPIPDSMSLADAATIPICYLTVYHSLFDKAHLESGDSILVHAGAGGVGMAAIHVCQARGIEVFTTCSDGKRQFIKDRFGLDDDHIFNSRDNSFKKNILQQTNGKGVDAVLNSLAGDLLTASVECIAPGGNFLEIGKFDIMQNTGLGLRLLEKNVSFHVIDLLQLWNIPAVQERWRKHIAHGFANNEIVPLPTHIYTPNDTKEAFRFMSQGKHRGKVLIDFQNGVDAQENAAQMQPKYLTKGRHLITGGLGGFALELAKRLSDRGAEELLLLGRSGGENLNSWQRRQLKRLQCKVTIVKGNVQDLGHQGELDTIWHTATLYRDAVFDNQNEKDWDAVFVPKVAGYNNLRKVYPETRMICFASVVGGHGNIGQANYSFANEGMEFASLGDNTLNIQWGFVGNVGQAAQMSDNLVGGAGYLPETVRDLLDFLDQISANKTGSVTRYALEGSATDGDDGPVTMEALLSHIAEVLGGNASDYDPATPLEAFGLDSLSTTEIFSWVNRRVSKPMPAQGTATSAQIMEHIAKYGNAA